MQEDYWNYDATADYGSLTPINLFGQPQTVRTSFGGYNPTRDVFTLGEQVIVPDSFSESVFEVTGTGYLANPTISHNALAVMQALRDQLPLLPGNLYQELMGAVARGEAIADQWVQDASAFIQIPPNFLG